VIFKKISAITLAVTALVATTTFAQDKNLSTLQRMGSPSTTVASKWLVPLQQQTWPTCLSLKA
jgi:hypothetical protein